jgi:hypothetical protein
MTARDLAITHQPTQRQIGRREASKPGRVTGRLKQALDLMVWEPMTDSEACGATGLRLNALRMALRLPHVRAYYREQIEVLRERESSRNIHRLMQIRDADNNMPAVNAIKELRRPEGDESGHSPGSTRASAGLTIIVQGDAQIAANTPHIQPRDINPLIDNDKPD